MKELLEKMETDCKYFETKYGCIVDYNGPNEVVIPKNINGEKIIGIKYAAFAKKELTSVHIPSTIEFIDDFAFNDNQLTEVILPNNLKSIGREVFGQNKNVNIIINGENKNFKIENKTLLSKDGSTIYAYFGDEAEYTMDNSVSEIKAFAFADTDIEIINIPDNVKTIEWGAFDYYALKSINLSKRNKQFKVENSALISSDGTTFYGLIGLKNSYKFQNGIKEIGACSCANNNLKQIELPESVTIIGNSAFHSNPISEVTLPRNIEYVDASAFRFNTLHTIKVRGKTEAIKFRYLMRDNNGNNMHLTLTSDAVITTKEPTIRFGSVEQQFNPEYVYMVIAAINNNAYDLVSRHLSSGIIPINFKDFFDTTPLMYASQEGHYLIVKLILDSGADVSIQNVWGNTALILASTFGFSDIVKLLLDSGANVNQTNDFGDTPLIMAAAKNQYEVAKILIDRGAETNTSNTYGDTALSFAIENNNPRMIQLLQNI